MPCFLETFMILISLKDSHGVPTGDHLMPPKQVANLLRSEELLSPCW